MSNEYKNVIIPDDSFIIFISGGEYYIINTSADKNAIEASVEKYISDQDISDYFIIENDLRVNNQNVVLFLSKDAIMKKYTTTLFIIILVTIIITIVVFLSIKMTSTLLTKRLNFLVRELNRSLEDILAKGDFPELGGNDEISRIESKIHEFIQRIMNYYRKIIKYEIDNKSLEVTLLQERINPHFLYNTLSAVKHAYDDEALNRLVDSMITYYRIALSKGENSIFIEKEIEMIEMYINIQKFAFDSDFSYSIELQDDIRQCYILKQLLQPIVENAILHGINSIESGGHVSVSCIQDPEDQNKIVFVVRDNGIGMPQKKQEDFSNKNRSTVSGYGLRNVEERIRLNYGKEYGIAIESEYQHGTAVTIVIPRHKKKIQNPRNVQEHLFS
jgi:sensor histidine kinase YesM